MSQTGVSIDRGLLAILIERAPAPSRELGHQVALALGWERRLTDPPPGYCSVWRRGDIGWTAGAGYPPWYIEELGEAWAEVEQRGWSASLRTYRASAPRLYHASCWRPGKPVRGGYEARGRAPAMALIAALLRAEAAS